MEIGFEQTTKGVQLRVDGELLNIGWSHEAQISFTSVYALDIKTEIAYALRDQLTNHGFQKPVIDSIMIEYGKLVLKEAFE